MQHVCKGCGLMLPASEYRVHKRGHRIGKCRACERAYQREWTKLNPEKYRRIKRESMARIREADPDKARAYANAYHAANRDKRTAKMREYYARRFFWGRAMKLRGKGRATTADLARLWKAQRGLCAMTGRRLTRDNAHLDHIVAKARGGTDAISNLRWLCAEANLALRELSDAEFVALCADVMSWIGHRIQQVENLISAQEAA
jgi:5-methylcytosine-specific restriction endonuclease McrA